jgi:hypothetical protein
MFCIGHLQLTLNCGNFPSENMKVFSEKIIWEKRKSENGNFGLLSQPQFPKKIDIDVNEFKVETKVIHE